MKCFCLKGILTTATIQIWIFQPPYDKTNKWHVRPAKTQISLGIRPVLSESSLSAWRQLGSLATGWAQANTLIRLGGCPGWSESSTGRTSILLVVSLGGSFLVSFSIQFVLFLEFTIKLINCLTLGNSNICLLAWNTISISSSWK